MGAVSVKKLYDGGMKVMKKSAPKPAAMKKHASQPKGKSVIEKGKH